MPVIEALHHKRIVLAVTGSIAVYKSVDLASKLTQAGALVDVIMTDSAQRFVSPLTFQSVTGRPVYTSLWQSADANGGLPTHIAHVGLGEGADLLVISPCTANTMAKLAQGSADDLLTVTALAVRCPVVIAPAMDGGMYHHPATQANLEILLARGIELIEPEEGRFASGLVGKGRLPETQTLIGHIRRIIGKQNPLVGKHIVVTAGGTQEPLDPVRFITNRSSGKQGYAIAQAGIDAGADVTLISTVNLPTPIGATLVKVRTAQELHDAVLSHTNESDVLIMAAAVSDYRPATTSDQKIKKGDGDLNLTLARNPDILLSVKEKREQTQSPQLVIGFAAESENLMTNAQGKLERKGLDLLVGNDITAPDAGFAHDTNRVILVRPDQDPEQLDLMSKAEIGNRLMREIAELL